MPQAENTEEVEKNINHFPKRQCNFTSARGIQELRNHTVDPQFCPFSTCL